MAAGAAVCAEFTVAATNTHARSAAAAAAIRADAASVETCFHFPRLRNS